MKWCRLNVWAFEHFIQCFVSMADTTTPTNPPIQDFQINLEEAPKVPETPKTEPSKAPLDLNLDLNLSEAPKDDDRLKAEDQKNKEETNIPVAEVPTAQTATATTQPSIETVAVETPTEPTVASTSKETPISEIPPEKEVNANEAVSQPIQTEIPIATPAEPVAKQPSTDMVEEPITTTAEMELQKDMDIINEIEKQGSTWWLAPEAITPPQPTPAAETPKTFDLDAMLSNVTPPQAKETPKQGELSTTATPTPVPPPAFTLPTTTTEIPVQAMPQVTIPQKKNVWVKVLLFSSLFAGLGFATFFILKTMYPIEFADLFSGQSQMHASETTTGTQLPTETIATGTEVPQDLSAVQENTWMVEIWTGAHESAWATGEGVFTELQGLWTETQVPMESYIGKLTDYAKQGEDFLAQGKAMNNNTVIKYGLFISKKATQFLEDIANGKQIDNLSGYFAQFDGYITEMTTLLNQMRQTTSTTASSTEQIVSPSAPQNVNTNVSTETQVSPETTTQTSAGSLTAE